jgi:hypothetical protein
MAPIQKDLTISALEAVHRALKPLDPADRQRVLASVSALLEVDEQPNQVRQKNTTLGSVELRSGAASTSPARPVAIRELIQERKPRTHPEFITLFAYYREKHQNLPTFSRGVLQQYYAMSRENPPKNFDRDFVKAIKRGWIHEDGESSYITSKGLELVESNFSEAVDKSTRKGSKRVKASSKKPASRSTR